VTSYTWIKFSDNADGTGLYDTPTANTKYIGIAANKITPTESNNKTDYVWSLFKGANGVDGENGYMWIRYADNAQGGGMSNNPDGKDYIGLAYNKTTATESDNPADYMWALYKGEKGDQGDSANVPKYRGVTNTADTGNTGSVTLKLGGEIIANVDDWVAYVGETVDNWIKGHCLRWNGTSWEDIEIKADGNFETNPYVAALMDLTEGAGDGTFMSILVRDLIAKTAMISEIQTTLLQIQKALFGGERFSKSGESVVDNGADKPGFMLGADGVLKASGAQISGTVNATDGVFNGTVNATSGTFRGDVYANNGSYIGLVDSIGFLSTKYLGSAINRTGGEIFTYFEFVPIGKKLNINGGGELLNNTPDGGTDQFHNCIALWIDRKTVDMIEIRGYPINYLDRWVLCQCFRNSNTVVSHRYLFSW
jgi:hypothetical protein